MKALLAAALFALTTGCVASAGYSGGVAVTPVQPVVTAEVSTDPVPDAEPEEELYEDDADLVDLNENVRVVYGASDPVFFSDGYYWRYGDDGSWYRSSVHTGGWSVYADIPIHIRTIERPTQYRSYKPAHYTPRVRKVGTRPATVQRTYRKPASRNYGNNRPAARGTPAKTDNRSYGNNRPAARTAPQPTHTTPAHKPEPARSYGNNRPDARAPAQPVKATPTAKTPPAAYKQADPPKKAEPTKPAPKKDPPKKDDDYKKKDKRK
jgi:hypothetical protein